MHLGVASQLFMMYLANLFFIKKLRSISFIITALLSVMIFSVIFDFVRVYITGIFFLFLFLVSLFFSKKVFSTFYYSLITVMLYIYSDNIVMIVVNTFFNGEITDLFRFIIGTITYVVSLLLVKYLTDIILKSIENESMFYKTSSVILLVTFIFFYVSIIFERSLRNKQLSMQTINNIYVLFYGTITIFICVSIGYIFRKEYLFNKRKREFEFLEDYTKDLEERYEEIRGFKHDYQNILLSVESFIRTNDIDSMKNYFYEELKLPMYSVDGNSFFIDSLSKICDRPVKSLISLKMLLAQNLNIKVNLTVQDKISILNVHQIVLVRILGIILDNSIEEARDIPESLIEIEIYNNQNKTIFTISNTTNLKVLDYSLLNKKGYTTKKGNDRGWGLSNIEKLIQSKPQKIFIETKITKGKFTQIITINSR